MPSWSAENEVKLLLTVIKTSNPKISRVTWEEIAATMGAGYTFEAVRQKYQNLKRDSEALNRGPATSDVTKATNSAAAKSKTTVNSTTDKGKLLPLQRTTKKTLQILLKPASSRRRRQRWRIRAAFRSSLSLIGLLLRPSTKPRRHTDS